MGHFSSRFSTPNYGSCIIRANAIAPGPFPTKGAFARLFPPEFQARGEKTNPLGRFGDPPELANLAACLFSPMVTYINGECVVIDGGEWLKAQGFASFTDFPREQVKAQMEAMRPKKG